MFVGSAGRRVDQKVVDGAPEHVAQELADHGGFFGAAPDDGGGAGLKEEGEGHAG